jgi:hypothetical protein
MRAVKFPPPILVEYRPSWPKFNPWLVFNAPIWVKFGQFGQISATFGISSAKISGGNLIARIRPFLTNFGQNKITVEGITEKQFS